MQTVPFNANWIDSGSLDLLAVYRRPRTQPITKARLEDVSGRPLWDYVNLPIKRHNDWLKKGYQYVTLARVADLIAAKIPASPEILASYVRHGEPEERTFVVQTYLQRADVDEAAEFERLKALVYVHGSAAAEAISQHIDPHFKLPDSLRDIPPGGPVSSAPAAAKAPDAGAAKTRRVEVPA